MNRIEAIIAETKSELEHLDAVGLLDDDKLYRDVILAIKAFGNNATVEYEDVIKVQNFTADLPDNFFRLREVRLAEPIGYEKCEPNFDLYHIKSTEYRTLITELTTSWNECEDCCRDIESKVFKKQTLFKGTNKWVNMNYDKGVKVMLTSPSITKYCEKSYNFTPESEHHQISIFNDKIKSNFKEGDLYIKYRGFPLDEYGDLTLPDSPSGFLETYLEYHLKMKTAERLIAKGVPNLNQLFSFYENQVKINKSKAVNELKINSTRPKQLAQKIQLENRERYNKLSIKTR